MNKRRVLFIINGMVKNEGVLSVSGGDVRLLEVMRNSDTDPYLLTTQNGREFIDKSMTISLEKTYIINHNLTSGIMSNFLISVKSIFLWKSGAAKFRDGAVYSSCEHLYDVLPALRLKLTNNCKWYAVYHWVEDYPWIEKRGNTPVVVRYVYWLNRVVSGLLIKWFSDEILAVSDTTKEKLIDMKSIKESKIKSVYCGVEYKRIREIAKKYASERGTRYDAVFMKRLNYGKGVLDLLKIWKKTVESNPDAKLGIIGDGPKEVVQKIEEFLKENNLEKNVDRLGVIYDFEEKFRIINSAKTFLLPTHEENWAIVVGEAMAVGTPVIVSKLKEITPIWQDNVTWCEVGDIDGFSRETLRLCQDNEAREKIANKALKFITRYDWEKIGKDELD